jgi:hypothetical protein
MSSLSRAVAICALVASLSGCAIATSSDAAASPDLRLGPPAQRPAQAP